MERGSQNRKLAVQFPPPASCWGGSARAAADLDAITWTLAGACVPSPAHALWSTATTAIMAVSSAAAAGGGRRWYFTREQLARSPSWRLGLDTDKELSYRQQAANLLQDMGQRLNVYPFGN